MQRRFDTGSLIVILVTLVLFVGALFTKGMTHDLLLEAGVFLVSVKLIIMSYKQSVASEDLVRRLERIQESLGRIEAQPGPGATPGPVDRSAAR